MRRWITIVALVVFLLLPGHSLVAGKYAASFLELGIGGRAMAMGGAYVALANDGSAFYWNPAGAAILPQQELAGMYATIFKSLSRYHHVGYTRPLPNNLSVSLNWIRLSVADIPRYNLDPEILKLGYANRVNDKSTFAETWQALKELDVVFTDDPLGYSNYVNDAFFLTLAKNYNIDVDFGWQYFVLPIQIPVGVNLKMIRQSLFDQTASGVGMDFGGMLRFGIDDLFDDSRLGKIALGYALRDIWKTKIKWDTDSRHSDQITRSWSFGASYLQPITRINGILLLSYEVQRKYNNTHHLGVEYNYYQRLAIRFGMDDDQFTAGLGMKLLFLHIDYAYRGHELGGSHRISTSVRF